VKILQVSLRFPPAPVYGGVPRTTYLVSKELVKRGHEVTIFTTDAYDANSRLKIWDNPAFMNGITVYRFRTISNYLAYKNVPIAPAMAFALRGHVKSFDVVHLREYFHFQAPLVHHYATKKNIPYVLQAHGSLPRSVPGLNAKRGFLSKSLPKKAFDVLFGHSIIKDASMIIASSRIESDQFKNAFAGFPLEKVVYLPNYIDRSSYDDFPERGHFRKKYGIDCDAKMVLFLSRIHEIKGADLLITAFSRVKRVVDPPLNLVIAGPDEGYVATLKSLADKLGVGNDVVFPGPLYGCEKKEAYVDADVFVLPSRYESFGNVAVEALACGTPAIVTNSCGVSEWINNDVGRVIGQDAGELCRALKTLLQDDDLSKTLGNNGKKLVEKEFGWEKGILQLEKLYEAISREKVLQR
jgi:glycosyltransferase involved in cell wall biosynthesis